MEPQNLLRPLAESDRPAIRSALILAWTQAKAKKSWLSQYTVDDADDLVSRIYDPNNMTVCIVADTFLLGYTVETPWYSKHPFLFEQFMLRLNGNRVRFNTVVEAMEALAFVNQCAGICSGTSFSPNDEALASRMQALGFERDAVRLFKPMT